MTAPIQAPENATSADPQSPTDYGPRTTDSARAVANRLNAQKSTGPRSAAGKAKSALNALKHGLTSQNPLHPSESPADYNLFAEGYLEELDPKSVEQFTIAQQLITVSWKLNRIPQIEAKVLAEYTDRHPLLVKWRQDCTNVERINATLRHPKPLPERPIIPPTTADDLIALSFFPKPPTPGVPTTGEPLGAALHRLRQYHTQLLNTYLKLLKKYQSSQNEPNPLATGNDQLATTPKNEPIPDDLSNLKSDIPDSPSSPLSTNNYQLSTNSKNEPILPLPTTDYRLPTTPAARLQAAINAVAMSSLPLNT